MAKYIFNGAGIVWDPEENKPLARFNKGVFETEDSKTVGKLKKIGYEPDEVIKDTKEPGNDGGKDNKGGEGGGGADGNGNAG